MNYDAWRITFQTSEAAARAAFDELTKMKAIVVQAVKDANGDPFVQIGQWVENGPCSAELAKIKEQLVAVDAVPTKVIIIESEAGWGQKIDDVLTFPSRAEAIEYVKAYNDKHNPPGPTPDWYMYARLEDDRSYTMMRST